jgi:hypothetical protein
MTTVEDEPKLGLGLHPRNGSFSDGPADTAACSFGIQTDGSGCIEPKSRSFLLMRHFCMEEAEVM